MLDADAYARCEQHVRAGSQRAAPTLLTPHPAEAGRLLNMKTAEVQADRRSAAAELARRLNAFVVLKGVGSICAAADGRWAVNTTGNPGLASGGTGDVLAGILGALLCRARAVAGAPIRRLPARRRLTPWSRGRGPSVSLLPPRSLSKRADCSISGPPLRTRIEP